MQKGIKSSGDLPAQGGGIEGEVERRQFLLFLGAERLCLQQSLVGGLRDVVLLGDFGAFSVLADELLQRLEEVEVQPQRAIQPLHLM